MAFEFFRLLVRYSAQGGLKTDVSRISLPETSVLIRLTPRNNLEEGIIHFNSGGTLRPRTRDLCFHSATELLW
jgi:hypothetical protein